MNNPKVTVLMSAYNTEKYLKQAIDSILGQTFSDFEFLIFNDGSTDSSIDIIKSYKDARIKFIDDNKNLGYVPRLNRGIDIAEGEYIARMDSDDISAPNRLEKQVLFMDKNLDVGVCGSWYDTIGKPENICKFPASDRAIRLSLFTYCPVSHPTVMLRSCVLKENKLRYDVNYTPAEDYFFWVILMKYCNFANIQEVLLHYRRHRGQISNRQVDKQIFLAQEIRNYQVEMLLARKLSDDEKKIHSLLFQDGKLNAHSLASIKKWIEQLLSANQQQKLYPEPEFSYFLKKDLYNEAFIRAKFYNFRFLRHLYHRK